MISESLKKKYRSLKFSEITLVFEETVKADKTENIKFFLESIDIDLTLKNVEYGLFLSCINNSTKTFKYLMFKQSRFNVNRPEVWIDCLVSSCSQNKQIVLDYILKYPNKPVKFNDENFYQAFLQTYRSITSLEYLINNENINLKYFIYKNDSEYLKRIVNYSRIDVIDFLIQKHDVSFSFLKELAVKSRNQHKGKEVLEVITKQNSKEIFIALNDNLEYKNKSKTLKI